MMMFSFYFDAFLFNSLFHPSVSVSIFNFTKVFFLQVFLLSDETRKSIWRIFFLFCVLFLMLTNLGNHSKCMEYYFSVSSWNSIKKFREFKLNSLKRSKMINLLFINSIRFLFEPTEKRQSYDIIKMSVWRFKK